jgi:uncharacterized membrane protein
MRTFLLCWLCVALVLFPVDMVWLRQMRPFYESRLGDLLLPNPRIAAAAAFYVLYAGAVAFFAVMPNLAAGTWMSAALYGAFFGLAAYGTYDVTNYATLRSFPLEVMAVDWTWGVVLTAGSATGAWLLMRLLKLA